MTKYNVDTAENMLRVMLMEPRTARKTTDVDHEKAVIKCLKMVSIILYNQKFSPGEFFPLFGSLLLHVYV